VVVAKNYNEFKDVRKKFNGSVFALLWGLYTDGHLRFNQKGKRGQN